MYYHVIAPPDGMYENMTHEEILVNLVCPFINQEVTFFGGLITRVDRLSSIRVFRTDKPLDEEWPVRKADHIEISPRTGKTYTGLSYHVERVKALENQKAEVTREIYIEARKLIRSGEYARLRERELAE